MKDYEKLGAFYLGGEYDLESGERSDAPLLYDSKDLTTHGVIIGMTGSGKTGLGIGLLEEAAMDRIPVIAIDPKGDLGNILLTFPDLRPEDFRPWVNERDAAGAGKSPDEYAAQEADRWARGLESWGQDGERIGRLREAADFVIYTPGSTAGRPVSVLRSFAAPPRALREDGDLFRERIQSTATSVLGLMGIQADPLISREHILLSTILEHTWQSGGDLDVARLIAAVQKPPVDRVGVMDIEAFFPAKERFELAMRLNSLLAAPGFAAWMEGEALDVGALLFGGDGRPRVSVLSIAHLSEAERMFFVSMLLGEVVAWMRTQAGTGSLRALLYMDEVAGYLPPTAVPPSKPALLTLLKQARAYGLGVVLATQNPVDLDYKALSNAGTWFIGRLQTERDKMRVLEGLEGAAAGGSFDRGRMEQVLAGLGKQVFLMHNVHESGPVTFTTRWVMSYLSGPLTREQIRVLVGDGERAAGAAAKDAGAGRPAAAASSVGAVAPTLPPEVPQFYVASRGEGEQVLVPRLLGVAEVQVSSAKHKVDESRKVALVVEVADGPVPVDWAKSEDVALDLDALEKSAPDGARWAPCPPAVSAKGAIGDWTKLLEKHVAREWSLELRYSPALKLVSRSGESERDFRARLQQASRERRDAEVERLRDKYAPKVARLEERLRRARQAIQRETSQASQRKLETAMSVGTALLGALLGRKAVSVTSVSRVGTAVRSAGRARKEAQDIERAEETAATIESQLAELEAELQREVEAAGEGYDASAEEFETVRIKPKRGDVHLHFVGLVWLPHRTGASGKLQPAWS